MDPVAVILLLSFLSLNTDAVRSIEIIPRVQSLCDATGGLCSDLECSASGISVTLNVPKLITSSIDIPNIHLDDRRCVGFPYDDTSVYISWSRGESVCGTELTVTPTHAIYRNHIYLPVDPAAVIYREITVINVTCSYPLNLNVSTGAVRPDISITYIPIENSGTFKVRMAIYTDVSYATPYTDPVIKISTKSMLYVGVFIEEPATDFSLLMINCYSTPTNNAYDPVRYNILMNSCPNPKDGTIVVLQNGITSMGRFYLQAFKFIGDYSYVYLHCEVYLCKESCVPTCSSRSSSEAPKAQGTLTYGPFRIDDSNGNSVGKASGFSVITIIGLSILNMFFV